MQGTALKPECFPALPGALAAAGEVAASLATSLRCALALPAPFPCFRAADLFPAKVAIALAELPFQAPSFAVSGKREFVSERIYFDPARLKANQHLAAVALAFQSPQIVRLMQELCAAQLEGTFLRIEYAIDANGFWLEPHTDLGVKKLTGLIPLAGDAADDLGTDLYTDPAAPPHTRLPFTPNTAAFFVPSAWSWHGFAPRPIRTLRKSLIVNYVSADWRSCEQLAFSTEPVGLV